MWWNVWSWTIPLKSFLTYLPSSLSIHVILAKWSLAFFQHQRREEEEKRREVHEIGYEFFKAKELSLLFEVPPPPRKKKKEREREILQDLRSFFLPFLCIVLNRRQF